MKTRGGTVIAALQQNHITEDFISTIFSLYLSPILDLHSSYLVSYTISERPILNMVTTMLEQAFETIPDKTGLILHSGEGWHSLPTQEAPAYAQK